VTLKRWTKLQYLCFEISYAVADGISILRNLIFRGENTYNENEVPALPGYTA
jgi:hypothetical protein